MPEKITKTTVELKENRYAKIVFGQLNTHLNLLEKEIGIRIDQRGNFLEISGEERAVHQAQKILNDLYDWVTKGQEITEYDIKVRLHPENIETKKIDKEFSLITKKTVVYPRTVTQKKYVESILQNDMVFGVGPAGTGKTFLAVAVGVALFLQNKIDKIILSRPAVEAGENLGFLPGDLKEKVDPYLRPLHDALHEMLPPEMVTRFTQAGQFEVAPLAYMRGRTLKKAFVILDEAQNTTAGQMKMFLTRMGEGTKVVVNGDPTQIDLPKGVISGLIDATKILKNIEEIKFVHFTADDVMRHALVAKIIRAYDSINH